MDQRIGAGAGHLAGGDEPFVRHLGARAASGRWPAASRSCSIGTRRAAARAHGTCARDARHRLQPLLLRERRAGDARPVPAAARRRAIRRPPRLRRGVDAGAALPRVRRALPESGGHRRRDRRDHGTGRRSAPAACVLPLHHPVRVAEEWAVVDNISNGRVGISFAAGWQPNDFVLRPRARPTRRQRCSRNIDVVRRLWRGETVEFPGATGAPVTVRTLPRPVQPELPIWLTSAGNPATFEQAGRVGRQPAHPPARADARGTAATRSRSTARPGRRPGTRAEVSCR